MAINTATIQHRRGILEDFNPEKLMPGELAVITDERSVYMGFPGGETEKIVLEKDFTSESIKEKLGYEPADKEEVDGEVEKLNKKIVQETSKLSEEIVDQQHSINALTGNDIDTEYYMTVKNHSVTPEMFGAVGDGVADDTNALKQCLLQDNPVYLSGNYRITEDLYISKHNFAMFGKVGGYSATSPTLYFENASLRINDNIFNICLKGFAIRSNTIGMLLDGEERMGNFLFEDLQFICKKCVKMDVESGYIWFVNCKFTSDGTTDDCLIDLCYTGTSENRLNYVYFDRCAVEGGRIPNNLSAGVLFKIGNCTAINITNCDLCNSSQCVAVDSSIGASQHIKMTNNYIWEIYSVLNMSSINESLFANNVVKNRSGQPLHIGNVYRNNAVVGNVFKYWTTPTAGAVSGNIFKSNVISSKSCSLERIAPREDLINVEKTHLINLGANESVTKTFNMKTCYVDTLYITCSDNDITYTSTINDTNFVVTLTNPTTENKEFLMFVH